MAEEPKSIEPEQFKHLLNGKINKPQHHLKYDYYEKETFETELNEFIAYSEVKVDLKQFEVEYNKYNKNWREFTNNGRRDIIQTNMNSLDFANKEQRLSSAKCLAYIALGCYGEYVGKQHLDIMKENGQLLFQCDMVSAIKQLLNYGCHQLETLSTQSNLIEFYCKEIDIYLTILYIVIQYNQDQSLHGYQLSEYIFDLVVRLKEHFTKTFPLKKLMLNLYKILHATLGDANGEEYNELKRDLRIACDLPIIEHKETTVKCTAEDLYSFYQATYEKYPTFTPMQPPNKIARPISIHPSTTLTKAMGLSKASKSIDLPYQTLFPSKNQPQSNNTVNGVTKKNETIKEIVNILPFTANNNSFCLTEANQVMLDHLYLSISNYQIIYEREKAMNRYQRKLLTKEKEQDDWLDLVYSKLNSKQQTKLNQIEQLYASTVNNFQSIVVVILKLLLSTVSIKDKENEILEDINVTRNREIISKAVSGILLLLLKWFKMLHVLKFEYLSQILIDSGCMLLILKLLGLQEVALLASKRTDDDSMSFLGFINKVAVMDLEEEEEDYTNKRNLKWSINLTRILQMLTKHKTHRIQLLAQYKSSAILKRLLKVGHPVMDLYVLKNLKNQVPFMGRKWRSSNMKIISAIYTQCLTGLNDEWLSTPEGSHESEEHVVSEVNLRLLTKLYNGQHYIPTLLPKMDSDSALFYPHKQTFIAEHDNDTELDLKFKNNYRSWLETNIYINKKEILEEDIDNDDDKEDDEEDEEDDDNDSDNVIGTPIPSNKSITADDLAIEINKLYVQELEREFKEKILREQQKQQEISQDGWDKPIKTTNSWGEDIVPTAAISEDWDDELDEIEPARDPLQGINWNNLSEQELKDRLTLVEEKTVQRWMNIDMDDPAHLKVLNTFEGEIEEDEEGWPVW